MDHSVLSCQSLESCQFEIRKSWECLEKELANPLDVFCYPTGRAGVDFDQREMEVVRKEGFRAGLSVTPGDVDYRKDGLDGRRFCLNRVAFPSDMDDFIQLCSWVSVLKSKVREF
jgi:hypothetical protein